MTLEILVNNKPITTYKDPQNNTFVEGRRGSKYSLRYTNNTSFKKKIVLFVDGLNVMTGDENTTTGYVVGPHNSIVIPGWRIDKDKVSEFVFSGKKGSYSEKSNSIGAIGLKSYTEKIQYSDLHIQKKTWPRIKPHDPWNEWDYIKYPYYPYYLYDNTWSWYSTPDYVVGNGTTMQCSNSVGMNSSNSVGMNSVLRGSSICFGDASVPQSEGVNNLGTGWGNEQEFHTTKDYTEFNPFEDESIVIYYDDVNGLERRGIVIPYRKKNQMPEAFPKPVLQWNQDFGCKPPKRK